MLVGQGFGISPMYLRRTGHRGEAHTLRRKGIVSIRYRLYHLAVLVLVEIVAFQYRPFEIWGLLDSTIEGAATSNAQ
jgi:hypothetical protein